MKTKKPKCSAKTREGKRCKHPVASGSNRCVSHPRTPVPPVTPPVVYQKRNPIPKAPRSNIGKNHQYLKPLPCSIKQLVKTSKRGKRFTYRIAKSSGIRYKQYCRKS